MEKMPCATSALYLRTSSQKPEAEKRGTMAMRPPLMIAGTTPSHDATAWNSGMQV